MTLTELKALLRANGHTIQDDEESAGRLLVSPGLDIYMTLARGIDVVLMRNWRHSYYLCKPDPAAIFAGSGIPHSLRERWDAVLAGYPPDYDPSVLAGLATWTLTRLRPHDRAFIWAEAPNRYYSEYRETLYDEVEATLGSKIGSSRWRAHLEGNPAANVVTLDTASDEFPTIVAAYFLYSSEHCKQIYFATGNGREVFQMHHHDKVILSIPDSATRATIVKKFREKPEIYQDASNYELEVEPEDMTEEEIWGEA